MTTRQNIAAARDAPSTSEAFIWWFVWLGAVGHLGGAIDAHRAFGGVDTVALFVAVALPLIALRALREARHRRLMGRPVAPKIYR